MAVAKERNTPVPEASTPAKGKAAKESKKKDTQASLFSGGFVLPDSDNYIYIYVYTHPFPLLCDLLISQKKYDIIFYLKTVFPIFCDQHGVASREDAAPSMELDEGQDDPKKEDPEVPVHWDVFEVAFKSSFYHLGQS